MVLNKILVQAKPVARNFVTSAVRQSDHNTRGIVGSNLPFSTDNRYKLLALMTLFYGSGLAAPFLLLRNLVIEKSQA